MYVYQIYLEKFRKVVVEKDEEDQSDRKCDK
jgi:hypothetical protein